MNVRSPAHRLVDYKNFSGESDEIKNRLIENANLPRPRDNSRIFVFPLALSINMYPYIPDARSRWKDCAVFGVPMRVLSRLRFVWGIERVSYQ